MVQSKSHQNAGRKRKASKGDRGERSRSALAAVPDVLLHPQTPAEPVWAYFWPVLALAFVVRAVVALSGDFMLHPDEIMQYLEPAHRLAFGNGVVFWEFWYGARSWLTPGLVAGVLMLFDAVGFGEPVWYVGGVKLTFCAISLLIPAGMYCFARRHFGEAEARVALLAGAFWYELVGFAHKPMTEFTSTAALTVLLALCVRPSPDRPGVVWPAAFLSVLTAAVRIQYAPLALALLGLLFFRVGKGAKAQLVLVATACSLAVGVFDAVSWDAGLFHSYSNYLRFNLLVDRGAEARPVYEYLWWLLVTGGGLSAWCLAVALRDLRRYGLLLLALALILITHSASAHVEYRFIFVCTPLCLLLGAGVVTRLAAGVHGFRVYALAGTVVAAVSLAGILNTLPYQDEVYASTDAGTIRFIRKQDPVFAAYRYLAAAPGVAAVWHVDRGYEWSPGYYYLHRTIPLYDARTGPAHHLHEDLGTLRSSVSHIVTGSTQLAVPGYVEEKAFGDIRILRREDNESPVRGWRNFTPTIADNYYPEFLRRIYADAPLPPANFGIRFTRGG